MENSKKKVIIGIIIAVVCLAILSFIIALFAKQPIINSFRIVFGSAFVLFLPGFIITYIFFPKNKKESKEIEQKEKGSLDIIERIALSFALSIAIVPLVVFYLNLIGVKINLLNSFLTILGIIIISSIILGIKTRIKKN